MAAHHLGGNETLVREMKLDFEAAAISDKLKALLAIAGKVQKGGKQVKAEDITRARQHGATDKEIHDAVLIAAAFCMYNRSVDGLATWAPTDPNLYRENGRRLAEDGYVVSTERLPVLKHDRERTSSREENPRLVRHAGVRLLPTPQDFVDRQSCEYH